MLIKKCGVGKVGDINTEVYNDLAELPENQQVQALEDYNDSFNNVRNQSGFLKSIMKRIQNSVGKKQYKREDMAKEVQVKLDLRFPSTGSLFRRFQDKLQALEKEGRLDGEMFDRKLLNEFGEFDLKSQKEVRVHFVKSYQISEWN